MIFRLVLIEMDKPCFLKWLVVIFLNRSVCGLDTFFSRASPSISSL